MSGIIVPILFSAPLVRAILAGEKTQTRRLPRGEVSSPDARRWFMRDSKGVWCHGPMRAREALKRAGARPPQSILWVRESFAQVEGGYIYRADGEVDGQKWKPSIHMPREASRIRLLVTDVRFELLQEISEADILAEGVVAAGFVQPGQDLLSAWAEGWDGINAGRDRPNRPTTWARNPWVIVYTFEVLEVTGVS